MSPVSLRQRIEQDVKTAMKEQRALERDTLRMVLAAMKKDEMDLGRELGPEDELAAVLRAVKTRQESVEQFEKAGRTDLVAKERAEIDVVQRYLPKQRSEAETRALVQGLAGELGLSSKKDLGTLMKAVMARHKGEVDGKIVQRIAAEILP
jgi:uncharacterized protein YqeY